MSQVRFTPGFHKATLLNAPNAIRPALLQSAALGVRLHPIEINFCRIDRPLFSAIIVIIIFL